MTGLSTNVSSTQAVISLRSYLNPQGPTQQALVNYETADSFTADASGVVTVSVAPSTTDSAINLATLFAAYTAPVFVCVTETTATGIGFKITTNAGAGRVGVIANGWWGYTADATTALGTIYVTNSSSTATLYLSIAVMTQ